MTFVCSLASIIRAARNRPNMHVLCSQLINGTTIDIINIKFYRLDNRNNPEI